MAACVGLLIAIAPASADTFKGGLGSHRSGATLITNAMGKPKRILLGPWRADCRRHDGDTWRSSIVGHKPFQRATKSFLHETGDYVQPDGAFKGKVHASVTASKRSAKHWSGTLRAKVRVSKHGNSYDVCTTGPLKFDVYKRGGKSAPSQVAYDADSHSGLVR